MDVVFTLLAGRYERGSVLMTSNLAFSKWDVGGITGHVKAPVVPSR